MGVTLARKAFKGGPGHDSLGGGSYNLGAALTPSVDSFVGIYGSVPCGQFGCKDPTGAVPWKMATAHSGYRAGLGRARARNR